MVLDTGFGPGRRRRRLPLALAMASGLAAAVLASPGLAQTLNEAIASRAQGVGQGRLLVDAREIVYDNDRNTVSAIGDVQLHYQGRTLQADRVIYDRGTGRVTAIGNARLTDPNGTVATGDRFELTDDFKSGFIDSLRVTQTTVENGRTVTTRFTAPRAERTAGETTVFERGTYTACEPCARNPERPPLWQVKAARIIHNNSERTIYYEDASLEIAGIPVAYLPYFWTPDPTVRRKTGFLAPRWIASSAVGYGVTLPFFWALAPNYDITLAPTLLSRQGLLMQGEWRHRLETGSYRIQAAGIMQQDPGAFRPSPYGARDRDFRGSVETSGLFYLNERWKWGWNISLFSDKWFQENYNIRNENRNFLTSKDAISTVFLQGQGDRSWFDLRGYYFQGLSTYDWQKHQPVVHPVLDYNKRINGPEPLGGEIGIDLNVTSLTRQAAQYEEIPRQVEKYLIYDSCAVFERGKCLVRGVSGTHSRATATVSWRRQFIDGFGQAWTPFTYLRADGVAFAPNFHGAQNPELVKFLGDSEAETLARLMPAIGLEYRFPFVVSIDPSVTQIVEPIAQIIARPNEARIGDFPNEDAHSLVFDDTSLFDWDKFSGYDRIEGGVRANLGAQYTLTGPNGLYANLLFGQSVHLAGQNSFRKGDLVNVGRDSGLESKVSDYVARAQFAPNSNLLFTARGRFDQDDLSLKRLEAGVRGNFAPWAPLTASLLYANYAPQPELGYQRTREGLLASARWDLTPTWHVTGAVLLDLDNYLSVRDRYFDELLKNPKALYREPDRISVAQMQIGLGYEDECTIFSVNYIRSQKEISSASGEDQVNQTLLFRLELRTLGEASVRQNLAVGSSTVADR